MPQNREMLPREAAEIAQTLNCLTQDHCTNTGLNIKASQRIKTQAYVLQESQSQGTSPRALCPHIGPQLSVYNTLLNEGT